MSTISDYIGRSVDVSAFQGVQRYGMTQLEQTLALPGEGGRACTGIVKLGQQFLTALLTERGSVKHFPTRGSTFLTELRQGFVRSPADLFAAFSRALLDVGRNLDENAAADDPLDEQFASAEILEVAISGGVAVVSVRVASRDPDVEAVLPIPVSLR